MATLITVWKAVVIWMLFHEWNFKTKYRETTESNLIEQMCRLWKEKNIMFVMN